MSCFRGFALLLSRSRKRQQQLDGGRRLERGKPQHGQADPEKLASRWGIGQPLDGARRHKLRNQCEFGAAFIRRLQNANSPYLELAEDGLRRRDA